MAIAQTAVPDDESWRHLPLALALALTPERSAHNLRRLAAALTDLGVRLAAPDAEQGLAVPLDEFTFNAPVMTFITRAGLMDVNLEPAGTPTPTSETPGQ